jgi:hypothetical protein
MSATRPAFCHLSCHLSAARAASFRLSFSSVKGPAKAAQCRLRPHLRRLNGGLPCLRPNTVINFQRGQAVTESGIMKMIRMSEVNLDTSWSSVTRELAKRLAAVGDRLTDEELTAVIELAALSYQKARAEYQASVAYDLLLLRMQGKTPKKE